MPVDEIKGGVLALCHLGAAIRIFEEDEKSDENGKSSEIEGASEWQPLSLLLIGRRSEDEGLE